jgi:hypothetical protein
MNNEKNKSMSLKPPNFILKELKLIGNIIRACFIHPFSSRATIISRETGKIIGEEDCSFKKNISINKS